MNPNRNTPEPATQQKTPEPAKGSHTAPALRAAKALVIGFGKPRPTLDESIDRAASIIDRESGLGGLLAACQYALDHTIANGDAHDRLRLAIAKAEGATNPQPAAVNREDENPERWDGQS